MARYEINVPFTMHYAAICASLYYTGMFLFQKILEVVLVQGDADKRKEYYSYMTDIRGVIATRSTRQPNRIQPARVVRGVGAPSSAKKPEWR
jgi:hypothetical protein